MRKIKEILRLRYDLGLRQDQIARSCAIGQATVHRYLERFAATELKWPLAEDYDDGQLESCYSPHGADGPQDRSMIGQHPTSQRFTANFKRTST